MPSQKFTLRLPPALATAVQTHLDTTGLLFADLARAALSAYLADTPPTGADSAADTRADRQEQGYDASRFVLGRLCPRGHAYQGTGQTLRKRHSGTCAACEREQQRERRAARRQATQ
jgi:hypothetical protein